MRYAVTEGGGRTLRPAISIIDNCLDTAHHGREQWPALLQTTRFTFARNLLSVRQCGKSLIDDYFFISRNCTGNCK